MAEQRDALAETLTNAPVALSNLQNAYNPRTGTLDTRANINENLKIQTLLCNLIVASGQPASRVQERRRRAQAGDRPARPAQGLGRAACRLNLLSAVPESQRRRPTPVRCHDRADARRGPDPGWTAEGDPVSATTPVCRVPAEPGRAGHPVAALLGVSGCQGAFDLPLPGGAAQRGDIIRVTAEFADVLDLVPQSSVKVDQVTVGSVEKIELNGWTARVTLRLPRSVKLPDNAIAELKQTSLLGEKYIELVAAAGHRRRGHGCSDGDNIPLDRHGPQPRGRGGPRAMSLLLNGGGVAQLKVIETELNNAMTATSRRSATSSSSSTRSSAAWTRRRPRSSGRSTTSTSWPPSWPPRRTTSARALESMPQGPQGAGRPAPAAGPDAPGAQPARRGGHARSSSRARRTRPPTSRRSSRSWAS